MARLNSKIFVLVAAIIAVMTANHAASAGRAQQAQATDYTLDNAMGEIALYPGDAHLSFVEALGRTATAKASTGSCGMSV